MLIKALVMASSEASSVVDQSCLLITVDTETQRYTQHLARFGPTPVTLNILTLTVGGRLTNITAAPCGS